MTAGDASPPASAPSAIAASPDCASPSVGTSPPVGHTAGEESIYLSLSRGLCRECRRLVEVRYVAQNGAVYLERYCPTHGASRALVAESLPWYLDALQAPMAPVLPPHPRRRDAACPQACGPCTFHAQSCHLPVFSITNACNLRCPICFTFNRADRIYNMSQADFARHLDFVLAQTGGVDLVNITGGEPTLHPELCELLALAKRPGIGRVTMNSNGLEIARRPELAARLAELGVYVIMSLDTLDPATSVRLHGRDITAAKLEAIARLGAAGVQMTLLMVLVGDVNDGELPRLLDLLAKHDHVRSLTIQTMTYTGQGGGSFTPRRHIPVDGVERRIEEATAGAIKRSDFMPLPSAHPLCYGVTYLVRDSSARLHPFTRLLERATLARHLEGGYLLQPSSDLESELKSAIERAWAQGESESLLAAMKEMLTAIYPRGAHLSVHERQRRAEQLAKTIYVHAHMDEDTYEIGRAMRCPDQVPVLLEGEAAAPHDATAETPTPAARAAPRLIGACNYNLFYRQRDERFWTGS